MELSSFGLSPVSNGGLWCLDLRQLGSTDKWVGLLQKPSPGSFVVVRAVMCLGVTMSGTEIVSTPAFITGG